MQIEYFGTDLRQAGHYRRKINEYGELSWKSSLDFEDLDFYPYKEPTSGMVRGNMSLYETEKHTVCFIKGSPIDTRGGTVSVFFTKDKTTKDQFLEHLKTLKFFNDLVTQINK